ncbi:MAG: hypothetical protein K6V36_04585 [Anaerolineae bacterium]|nr:hypothetical protein [Anaerolineae bacterium]
MGEMMTGQPSPVPAVPSVVLALGGSLRQRLGWLEQRFRSEMGPAYPGNLLRFRLITHADHLSSEALRGLCDPLLVHPLWLSLVERGLAPGRERGPQLNVYAIVSQEDPRGCGLLADLCTQLRGLYEGDLAPRLCLFYVGGDLGALPALDAPGRPVLCFALGHVKELGYRTADRHEPFETVRLALNALLASNALAELEEEGEGGLHLYALGASAIAVARPQMETLLRNTLLQRLAEAWLTGDGEAEERLARRLEARTEVGEVFGLAKDPSWADEPDELWEKQAGRRIAGLGPEWANELLGAWGLEIAETRHGHWRVRTGQEGDLFRHLEQTFSEVSEVQEEAKAALAQELVRLADGLRRHFRRREEAVLARWHSLVSRIACSGPGCLHRLEEAVSAAAAALERASEALRMQRTGPLWLHSDRDVLALAHILSAQMVPVHSAARRARAAFVPPRRVVARLVPFILLLGVVGSDLWRGWPGAAAGLAVGAAFALLAVVMQSRRLRRETYAAVRELCRLYENAIGGLVLAEAHVAIRRLQEAVTVTAEQMRDGEQHLHSLAREAREALDELARLPYASTYLEEQLLDPAHCARVAGQAAVEGLLGGGEPTGNLAELDPAGVLAATMRGELPAVALGAGLVEAVGRAVARRGWGAIETRVEELLVEGRGRPFSPEGTMEGLRRRALPLWPDDEGAEIELVVMSREAAIAFRGWLSARAGRVRVLPTLQRDRISYLRLRRLGASQREGTCTG